MSVNEPMTQERLDAIQARVDAAQNTPWQRDPDDEADPAYDDYTSTVSDRDGDPIGHCPDCGVRSCYSTQNADLITNAPEDLTDLLAEVERLRPRAALADAMIERVARDTAAKEAFISRRQWEELPDDERTYLRAHAHRVLARDLTPQEGS